MAYGDGQREGVGVSVDVEGEAMRVLLLDTETTGLNPEVDHCIEVAVCIYDLTLAAPGEIWYRHMPPEDVPELPFAVREI